MSIQINQSHCISCKKCVSICPGNLIQINAQNKAYIKSPAECWGCASCVKECPVQAIKLYLGADINGDGATTYAIYKKETIQWVIETKNGEKREIIINRNNANEY